MTDDFMRMLKEINKKVRELLNDMECAHTPKVLNIGFLDGEALSANSTCHDLWDADFAEVVLRAKKDLARKLKGKWECKTASEPLYCGNTPVVFHTFHFTLDE